MSFLLDMSEESGPKVSLDTNCMLVVAIQKARITEI